MSGRRFARTMLTAVVVAGAACDRYAPDSAPKDPGTVMALVTDTAGAPIPGVWVYVHDLPNSVGTTFSEGRPTDAAGVARFQDIAAGQRHVEVKPPDGYTTSTPITQVDVVRGQIVSVRFTVAKN